MEEKNNSNLSHFVTGDGSSTVINARYQASYHSIKSAFSESMHVFINAGLVHYASLGHTKLRILEYGFGTGLNVILSIEEAIKRKLSLEYWSLDNTALPPELSNALFPGENLDADLFQQLHNCEWDTPLNFGSEITFRKCFCNFLDFSSDEKFDIIYYDAFSPKHQPELWTMEAMQSVLSHLRRDGLLVSYCASSAFKRNLKNLNCKVETLAGPPGKREMTRVWLK